MNKPLLGLILGVVLGAMDGLTAFWTAPELRAGLAGIVMWSSVKGLVVGLVAGIIARKLVSPRTGVLMGLGVALLFTVPIAIMNVNYYENTSYYWKIILPGALTGMIVGYATVRHGHAARAVETT